MDDHRDLWDPPEELIDRSQLNGIPRHGIGRGSKVSKEEIVALLTALDLFASGSYDHQLTDYRRWLFPIADALSATKVSTRLVEPRTNEQWPVLEIEVDFAAGEKSAMEICRNLRKGTPPVYVGHAGVRQGGAADRSDLPERGLRRGAQSTLDCGAGSRADGHSQLVPT